MFGHEKPKGEGVERTMTQPIHVPDVRRRLAEPTADGGAWYPLPALSRALAVFIKEHGMPSAVERIGLSARSLERVAAGVRPCHYGTIAAAHDGLTRELGPGYLNRR